MFDSALKSTLAQIELAKNNNLISNYALIGGLAVSYWSSPRATADIDIAISADNPQELADFLEGNLMRGDDSDPLKYVIKFPVLVDDVEIGISLIEFPKSYNNLIFQDFQKENVLGVSVNIISIKSLIILKLYAGSMRDLADVSSLLDSNLTINKEDLLQTAKQFRLSEKLVEVIANK
jgi:hypothetical protein